MDISFLCDSCSSAGRFAVKETFVQQFLAAFRKKPQNIKNAERTGDFLKLITGNLHASTMNQNNEHQ